MDYLQTRPRAVRPFTSGDGPPARVVRFAPSAPPLVPVLQANAEVTADEDRVLTTVALGARRGDVRARNVLYAAYEPKIARFVNRYGRGDWGGARGRCWEREDIAQEAFLVFADLIAGWPGGDSFSTYLLGHFPWKLRDAVRRLSGPARRSCRLDELPAEDPLADGSAAAAEAVALLEALADALPERDRCVVLWHLRDGEQFGAIAGRLFVSQRTMTRWWRRLRNELKRSLSRPPA